MNPAINFAPARWQAAGCPVAWTYHDLLPPYLFPKAGARLRRYVTERPAARADLTIVTNEGDRLRLAARHRACGSKRRAAGAHPHRQQYSARDVTTQARAAYRRRLGYGPDDFVIVYFGFLNRSKGGLTLIETLHCVLRELPQPRLLMIGERVSASDPTNYAYLQEVKRGYAAHGLDGAGQWTGHLDAAAVGLALAAADILLMPYADGLAAR